MYWDEGLLAAPSKEEAGKLMRSAKNHSHAQRVTCSIKCIWHGCPNCGRFFRGYPVNIDCLPLRYVFFIYEYVRGKSSRWPLIAIQAGFKACCSMSHNAGLLYQRSLIGWQLWIREKPFVLKYFKLYSCSKKLQDSFQSSSVFSGVLINI